MFEDPLCSLSKSLGIHGVNDTRPCGQARVRADTSVLPLGNFITDATVHRSHGRPSGHRPTVRSSAIVRMTTLPTGAHILFVKKKDESLRICEDYCGLLWTQQNY
jgi:hypothetical protein